jgi:hypothetical protein
MQQRFQRRSFVPHTQKKSTAAYASLELKLIWTLLQASRLSEKDRSIFTFDADQQTALRNLWIMISKTQYDARLATSALESVFQTVYYPQTLNTGLDTFNSPVIVFLLLETLTDDGAYRSIFLVPPVIAKVQYAMRLHATPSFHRWFETYDGVTAERRVFIVWIHPSSFVNVEYRKSKRFCEKYLQDANIAPFATVREWMHRFSRTSKATKRAVSVWWKGNVVEVGDTQIDFARYKLFLHQILNNLEQHVEEKVLLGVYTLADLENTYNISHLEELCPPEDNLIGNGILLDVRKDTLRNEASIRFFAKLKKKGLLGISIDERGLVQFKMQEGLLWLSDIDKAMHILMPLCHVLEGPPGRMTEEAAIRLTNTEESSRGLVFEKHAGTGGFRSGYHKNTHVTGDHKDILRLVPYRLFALLYALIRVVRPIELQVLFDLKIPTQKRQKVYDDYGQCIFASMGKGWDEKQMSQALERFFKTGLDIKMGVRIFRHFAVAVQRHFRQTNYGIYETAPDERRLALIADLMAGHTTKVAEQYYAREPAVVVGIISKSDYIRLCQDWHALHGFSTSRDAEKVAETAEGN